MKAHEIYQQMEPALVGEMLDWFRANDRNVYKSAVGSIASQRKVRPVFVQKKTLAEQYAWIHKSLQAKGSDLIGEHLLQVWLMAGKQDMLVAFCNAVGIEHDGKGIVEGELPTELDAAKLSGAVEQLLASHDPRVVTLYLTLFNQQRTGGWEPLTALLRENPRLTIAAA